MNELMDGLILLNLLLYTIKRLSVSSITDNFNFKVEDLDFYIIQSSCISILIYNLLFLFLCYAQLQHNLKSALTSV